MEREVKKLGAGLQKKASVSDVPCIEVMDTDQKEEVEQQETAAPVFPVGVFDIDGVSEDKLNPQLCVEYAPAIYAYLREVENGLSIRKEFLQG